MKVTIDLDKYKKTAIGMALKEALPILCYPNELIGNYHNFWKIEKAFGIAKKDIKIRPDCHRILRRIGGQLSNTFVAYKVYKELERPLKEKGSTLSPEKALDIAKGIYTLTVKLQSTGIILIRHYSLPKVSEN